MLVLIEWFFAQWDRLRETLSDPVPMPPVNP